MILRPFITLHIATSSWIRAAFPDNRPVDFANWKITKATNDQATKDQFNGAQYKQVLREQLKQDGFTPAEIEQAVPALRQKF